MFKNGMVKFASIVAAAALIATVTASSCDRSHAEVGDKAYYSVTLVNNTGFFGHIASINGREIVMTDVYYLRTTPTAEDPQRLNISLVAKKDDVYGPTNELVVNWDQVLMYEKLSDDSKMLQLIERQKEQSMPPAPPAPGATPAPGAAPAAPAATPSAPPPPPPAK